MSSTLINGSLNTYSTALTNGSYPADSAMIEFTNWARALAPWQTPFLDWIGYGPAINQPVFYFGQSYRPELESTVGSGGIDSSGATTALPVATGTGYRFSKWDIIALFDTGTTDWVPTEIMWVTADPTANGLTVDREQQGTTATAFVETDRILIIGHAEPQNEDHNESSVVRGDRQFNYFQRFADGVSADIAAQNQPTFEHATNPMLADFEEKMLKQRRLLERAVLFNQAPVLGTPASGAKIASQMGGLDNFITTNDVSVSGAVLTKAVFDDVLGDLFDTVDQSLAKVIVMSYRTKALINKWYNPIRMVTDNPTNVQERVDTLTTDFGSFSFKAFQNFPEGVVYILDPNEIDVHPFAGADWHITERSGEQHGADHDHKYFSGDFSLSVRNEAALAKLSNFSTTVADYPDFASGPIQVTSS